MQTDTRSSTYSRALKVTTVARCGQRYAVDKNILRENTVEVSLNGVPSLCITCTPTHVRELIVGRLYSEGYLASVSCIKTLELSADLHVAHVMLDHEGAPERNSLPEVVSTTGSSGEVLQGYATCVRSLEPYDPIAWDANAIFDLYENFALDTPLHSLTKGTHSCRLAIDGTVVFVSEDIGRHNAFDKAIGYALLNALDITRTLFFISGRIPVDMVSKAVRARIPVLASKAAPTDQAVIIAQEYGLTLICLVNEERLLVFSGVEFEGSS